jgi:hypothetical protein
VIGDFREVVGCSTTMFYRPLSREHARVC